MPSTTTFPESDKELVKRILKLTNHFEALGSFAFGLLVIVVVAVGVLLGGISWREYLFGEPELTFPVETSIKTQEPILLETLPTQPDLYQKDGQWYAKNLPAKYVVKTGDSTWEIASAIYGSGDNYRDIETANGLPLNANLEVGQTITLPDVPSLSTNLR